MHKSILFLAIISFCFISFSQELNNSWEFLGPEKKPLENRRQSANGIGPVEFITANKSKEGYLLAGSLNGGLFYTVDGGNQWINSGSDDWDYSGCSWAVYHPTKETAWFANSCQFNANGGPGTMGNQGGIYRTKNAGLNWELVADKSAFMNSPYMTIFGMKFHPTNSKVIFIYTSEGLYFSTDCMADNIQWNRVKNLGGWVYDLEFTEKNAYVSQMQHGKWSLYETGLNELDNFKKVDFVADFVDEITSITCEVQQNNLLVLMNFARKGDELWKYTSTETEPDLILKNQRVIFGKGNTLALSPHDSDELMLGYSTMIKRWKVSTKSEDRIKSGYHVDIEGVTFDPFDTMKVYIATHGGVYVSTDDCESWKSLSNGIGIAEVEGLAVSESNPELMAIGCFHDGSTIRADFANNGIYEWKNINGGDGLIPLMPASNQNVVYTSNQYLGGGLYYSTDTGRVNLNLHGKNNVKTSGWQMAAVLHPVNQDLLYFNFEVPNGSGKGNIDIGRTNQPKETRSLERISNFKESDGIEVYTIYGIYNSKFHPNVLFAHMLEYTKDENGKGITIHRLWRTDNSLDSAQNIIDSWYELEIPRSSWIGSVTMDSKSSNKLYLSYTSGQHGSELGQTDYGMIYQLKYKKSTKVLKKEISLSQNIPYSLVGRYSLSYDADEGIYFGTRTGVYYGDKKTLKGKRNWVNIGQGLPHCKVRGLYYNAEFNLLTIGYYGRGVWRYYLPE